MPAVSTYSSCIRSIVTGGLSAALYFSAGVAFFYFYKKNRDRSRYKNRLKSSDDSTERQLHDDAFGESSVQFERSKNDISNKETSVECGQVEEFSSKITVKRDSDTGITENLIENDGSIRCHATCPDVPSSLNVESASAVQSVLQESAAVVETSEDDAVEMLTEKVEIIEVKSENFDPSCNHFCDGEVSKTMMIQQSRVSDEVHTKNECIDSPSVSSDIHSIGSQDSGKGASTGLLTSAVSPISDVVELPPIYEFEIPQDIVGLVIGRKGATIKYFTDESGAHIVIRHHHYSSKHKICTIEGTREQINKCLRLIRHKFPPSRFPELKLTPLLPPPIVASHSPVFDPVVNLNLPEGVSCEVVLSSVVDAGHFFVQQPTHPTYPSLARLDQYMLAVYNQSAGVPGLPKPIDVGIICAAPVMAGWYRAQTVAYYEDTDEVLLKFVDYGGYSNVSASDLRQIRSDFMTLPFQAVECCLAYVKPIDENEGWSAESYAFFEQCVRDKVAETFLLRYKEDSVAEVELYCSVNNEMVLINRLLADNGYAIWCSEEEAEA